MRGVVCLYKHEKKLFHPVGVQYAALLQEQHGGGNGELEKAKMYFSLSDPAPNACVGNPVNSPQFSN